MRQADFPVTVTTAVAARALELARRDRAAVTVTFTNEEFGDYGTLTLRPGFEFSMSDQGTRATTEADDALITDWLRAHPLDREGRATGVLLQIRCTHTVCMGEGSTPDPESASTLWAWRQRFTSRYSTLRWVPIASAICWRGMPASMQACTASRRRAEAASACSRSSAASRVARLAASSSSRFSSSSIVTPPRWCHQGSRHRRHAPFLVAGAGPAARAPPRERGPSPVGSGV